MNINISKISNGLTIATDSMSDIDTVSAAIAVRCGSQNEIKKNNGISHFLEHMAFKGTKTRNAKQISEEIDRIGGVINAFTSQEKTVYYIKVLKEDLEKACDILSDIIQNSVFDQEEIEKEKGVILQEINMTNDTPDDVIFDYMMETAYGDTPLGRPILGRPKNIKNFQRKDFVSYIEENYKFNRMTLVCAGKCEHSQMIELGEKYFLKLSSDKTSSEIPQKSSYRGGEFLKYKKLEQVNFVMGYESPSYLSDDYHKVKLFSTILGGEMSSRLFQEIREKRGLAYSIYSFVSAFSDTGIFGIYSATSKDKVNEVIKIAKDELNKAVGNITNDELEMAKNQYKVGLIMSNESAISRMNKLAADITLKGKYISNDETIGKILNITKSDIMQAMEKLLVKSKPVFCAIGDVKNIKWNAE